MSKAPVVRPFSWLGAVPQLVALAALIALCGVLLWERFGYFALSIGAFVYLGYSYGSRTLLLRHQNRGRRLTDAGRYPEAIRAFQASYDFFENNVWLDNARSIVMMSAAVPTYREMALINIAYCYVQMGNIEEAKGYYRHVLDAFPDSIMAQTALNFIETVEQDSK